MKNITIYVISFALGFCFLNSTNISGQNNQIKWGPQLEGKGLVKLIGEEGDFLYATQSNSTLLSSYFNFIKIDKATLQIVQSKKMDLSAFSTNLLDLSINDGKLQALVVMKGKNFRKITYDLELNEISNELIEKFEKFATAAEIIEGPSIMLFTDMIYSFRSYDKSKVVVMLTKFGKKRKGVKFFVFDIVSGLTELYRVEIEGVNTKSEKRIEDIELLSDGRIIILMKQYIDGKSESKKKKPNYNYAIYKLGLDKSIVVELLPKQTNFWKNAILKTSKDRSILVAGLTQLKNKDRPDGLQIIKCNVNGETLYNKTHKLIRDGEKDKLEKTFYLRYILNTKDNGFVLLTEDVRAKIFADGKGYTKSDIYYSHDILLDAFDDQGEKKWSECIYRKAIEEGRKKLLTSPIIYNGSEGISLFYNTIEKNVEVYNSKDLKRDKLPNKKPVVLGVKIDDEGTLSFDQLTAKDRQHLVTNNSFAAKDKIYFVGAKDNKMKKMNIGTLDY